MSQLRRRSFFQWRQEGILGHLSGSDNKYLRRWKNGPGTFEKSWKGFVSLKSKKTPYLIQNLQVHPPYRGMSVQPRWGAKGSSPWSAPITFIGPWRMPWWQDLLGTIVDMLFTESKCGKEGGTRLIGETDRRPLRQIQRAEAEEQERKWRWVGPLAGCLLQPGSGSCAVNRKPEGGNTYFTALLLSFET